MTTALSKQQASDLRACEQVIAKGMGTFRAVGQALAKIRDERLYKASHKSFEAYCQERWQFGRSYAARLIQAADVPEVLPNGNRIENESQAREWIAEQREQDEEPLDTGGGAASNCEPLTGTESDSAGAPLDRVEWVVGEIEHLWDFYVDTFGAKAERFAFIAGLENWQARSENHA